MKFINYHIEASVLFGYILSNIVSFVFAIVFLCIYLKASKKAHRMVVADHQIFQRLRIGCVLISAMLCLWPIQYYFHMPTWIRVIIVFAASLSDLGVAVIYAVIAYRIFTAYHKIRGVPLPSIFRLILGLMVVIIAIAVVLDTLSYGFPHAQLHIFDKIFYYYSFLVLFIVFFVFIVMLSFLLKILSILCRIYIVHYSNNIKMRQRQRREQRESRRHTNSINSNININININNNYLHTHTHNNHNNNHNNKNNDYKIDNNNNNNDKRRRAGSVGNNEDSEAEAEAAEQSARAHAHAHAAHNHSISTAVTTAVLAANNAAQISASASASASARASATNNNINKNASLSVSTSRTRMMVDFDPNEKRIQSIYQRMILLCVGFCSYWLITIAIYIFYAMHGTEHFTDTFAWVLVHDVIAHTILLLTFYCYVRQRPEHNQYFQKHKQHKHKQNRNHNVSMNMSVNNKSNKIQQPQQQHRQSTKKKKKNKVSKQQQSGTKTGVGAGAGGVHDDNGGHPVMNINGSQVIRHSKIPAISIRAKQQQKQKQRQSRKYYPRINPMTHPQNSIDVNNQMNHNHNHNRKSVGVYHQRVHQRKRHKSSGDNTKNSQRARIFLLNRPNNKYQKVHKSQDSTLSLSLKGSTVTEDYCEYLIDHTRGGIPVNINANMHGDNNSFTSNHSSSKSSRFSRTSSSKWMRMQNDSENDQNMNNNNVNKDVNSKSVQHSLSAQKNNMNADENYNLNQYAYEDNLHHVVMDDEAFEPSDFHVLDHTSHMDDFYANENNAIISTPMMYGQIPPVIISPTSNSDHGRGRRLIVDENASDLNASAIGGYYQFKFDI